MLQASSVVRYYSEDFELEFLPRRLTMITEQRVCLQTNIQDFVEQKSCYEYWLLYSYVLSQYVNIALFK